MTIPEILNKAADLIQARGWYQGGYMSDPLTPGTCALCVLGAINAASGLTPSGATLNDEDDTDTFNAKDAAHALADHLNLTDDVLDYGLTETIGTHWNDHPVVTADQVISELRACAQALTETD